jgi:hypothetical protein
MSSWCQPIRVAAILSALPIAAPAPLLAQDIGPSNCPQERAVYKPWGEEGAGPRLAFYLDEEQRAGPYPNFKLLDEDGKIAARFTITVSTGAGKSYVLEAEPQGQPAESEVFSGDLGSILTVDVVPDTDPPRAAAWDGISVDGSPASQNIWIDQFANWDWYDYQHRPASAGLIGAGSLWELDSCQPPAD